MILVVDDNSANLLLTRVVLEQAGYQVALAQSVLEAEEWLAVHQPDLILMDLEMPLMDGLEYTRRLRTRQAMADVPIVAVTAYTLRGDRVRALRAGCDDLIEKPIDVLELPRQVARAIGARAARQTPAAGPGQPGLGRGEER